MTVLLLSKCLLSPNGLIAPNFSYTFSIQIFLDPLNEARFEFSFKHRY